MKDYVCAHGIECEVSLVLGWNSVIHKTPIDKTKTKEYCSIHDKMNTLELEEILSAFGESKGTYFDEEFTGAASKILAISETESPDDAKMDGLTFAFSKLKDAQKENAEPEGDTIEANKYARIVEGLKHDERLDNLKKEALSTMLFDEANKENKADDDSLRSVFGNVPGPSKKRKKKKKK